MSRYVDLNNPHIIKLGRDRYGDVMYHIPPDLPTLDVRENVHAHWEDWSFLGFDMERYWFRRCSNCFWEREDDNEEKDTPFCPNCGAVMDEGCEEECENQQ